MLCGCLNYTNVLLNTLVPEPTRIALKGQGAFKEEKWKHRPLPGEPAVAAAAATAALMAVCRFCARASAWMCTHAYTSNPTPCRSSRLASNFCHRSIKVREAFDKVQPLCNSRDGTQCHFTPVYRRRLLRGCCAGLPSHVACAKQTWSRGGKYTCMHAHPHHFQDPDEQ